MTCCPGYPAGAEDGPSSRRDDDQRCVDYPFRRRVSRGCALLYDKIPGTKSLAGDICSPCSKALMSELQANDDPFVPQVPEDLDSDETNEATKTDLTPEGSQTNVWSYFVRNVPTEQAICNDCGNILSCKGGSTKSLERHLQNVHHVVFDETKEESGGPHHAWEVKEEDDESSLVQQNIMADSSYHSDPEKGNKSNESESDYRMEEVVDNTIEEGSRDGDKSCASETAVKTAATSQYAIVTINKHFQKTTKNVYQCSKCPYESFSEATVKDHMDNEHLQDIHHIVINEAKEKSGGVEKQEDDKENLIYQNRMVNCGQVISPGDSLKLYKCSLCSYLATKTSYLQSHLTKGHGKSSSSSSDHMKGTYNIDLETDNTVSNKNVYQCSKCQYESLSEPAVKDHIKSEHLQDVLRVINEAKEKYAGVVKQEDDNDNSDQKNEMIAQVIPPGDLLKLHKTSYLQSHLTRVHGKISPSIPDPQGKNNIDSETDNTVSNKVSETTLKKYKCAKSGCGHLTNSMKEMVTHKNYCTGSPDFGRHQSDNNDAPKVTAAEAVKSLGPSPVTMEEIENTYEGGCKEDDKSYASEMVQETVAATRHERHASETVEEITRNVYQCSKCQYESLSEATIKDHMKNEHQYACTVLIKSQTIVNHKCKECGKSYTTRWKLKDHQKYVHSEEKEKDVKCGHCGKAFLRNKYLIRHQKKLHPEVKETRTTEQNSIEVQAATDTVLYKISETDLMD